MKGGFALGKDLLIGTNPISGAIMTGIRGRNLVYNPMKIKYYFSIVLLFFITVGCDANKRFHFEKGSKISESRPNTSIFIQKLPLKDGLNKNILNKENLSQSIVLGGKVSVLIPDSFRLMEDSLLNIKYPSIGHRPTEVYTNKEGTVNIAFNYTNNKATDKDLPQIKKVMEKQFKQTSIVFIKSSKKKISGKDFVLLEFISPAANTHIYNMIFVTTIDNRLLMGTFNCTKEMRKKWEIIGKKTVQSLKIEN